MTILKKKKLMSLNYLWVKLLVGSILLFMLMPTNIKPEPVNELKPVEINTKKTYGWSKLVWSDLSSAGFSDKEIINILYNMMAESGGRLVEEKGNKSMYRGRGYIQLTGKKNYEYYGKKLGIDLVNKPELANNPVIASKIATQFFKDNKAWRGIKNYDTPEMVIKALAPANTRWSDRHAWLIKNKISPPSIADKPVNTIKA